MLRVAPARLLIAAAVGCLVLALALRASQIDRSLFLAINDAAWRWLPPTLPACVTILGHGLCATMLLAPALLRAPGFLVAGVYATPIALLLSRAPKALIDSPRPAAVLDPTLIHINGIHLAGHNSFPSGHAITAFLVVGVLLAGDGTVRLRWPAALAIATTGVAVAASRIAVGAHWPSDVLAGAGLGLLAGLAGALAQQRWRIAAHPAARVWLALLVLACAATLTRLDLGYPLAQPLQFALAALGAAMAAATLWRGWAHRSHPGHSPG
jgi:membrane-associated phospholipid phosphatase